ncbi:hypothetical protein CEXT_28481 [Caerostris extrusa]|uniref:Uncharacterized protein n=1 Tax=Caerostris extrusa TaxID=172846 RepID=A0AAV4SW24_CAEEX|nr:hypothetical protein CEXT_28481 [Caerostris extrusa]
MVFLSLTASCWRNSLRLKHTAGFRFLVVVPILGGSLFILIQQLIRQKHVPSKGASGSRGRKGGLFELFLSMINCGLFKLIVLISPVGVVFETVPSAVLNIIR